MCSVKINIVEQYCSLFRSYIHIYVQLSIVRNVKQCSIKI